MTTMGAWKAARAATILAAALALGAPASAFAQARTRGGSGGGGGGGTRSGGGSAGRAAPRTAPAPAPASGAPAAPSSSPSGSRTAPATSGNETQRSSGRVVGSAVPRGGMRPVPPTTIIVPGGYYGGFWPWAFGGLGFGGYYSGYYDPFSPWYGGYAYSGPVADDGPTGSMRLIVKPRDAQVFVDGYLAGTVDDFDGIFQRLHAVVGPHHIEVRAPGYETLALDVEFHFGDTIKYEGELQRTQ